MIPVRIHETDGINGLPDGFLDLARIVYENEPQWIPENPGRITAKISSAHSWFNDGRARCFLIPGRGRVAGFISPKMVIDGVQAAFFGYWETMGSPEDDACLWARVEEWSRQEGAKVLYGPINFTTFDNYRIRVSAEPGARTFQAESFNPPDYAERLKRAGFSPCREYVVQIGPTPIVKQLTQIHADLIPSLVAEGYRFEPLTIDGWMAHLDEMHTVADNVFADNFAYTPISYETFAAGNGRSFISKACPRTSCFVFAPNGRIAAFSIMYPHYGPLVTQSAGERRIDVSKLNHEKHAPLLDAHPPRVILVKTMATTSEHRRKGIFNAMATYAIENSCDAYDVWFGTLIRSDNPSRRYATTASQFERRYALFHKALV